MTAAVEQATLALPELVEAPDFQIDGARAGTLLVTAFGDRWILHGGWGRAYPDLAIVTDGVLPDHAHHTQCSVVEIAEAARLGTTVNIAVFGDPRDRLLVEVDDSSYMLFVDAIELVNARD